eukprot:TRINITY_DN778_c0_g1_i11.p1 TRINITY_DN778_c0_g1~~TRINITY_DN778_c0_g1_i11.p1  ORF type:complete len:143 (-),score=3.64 TRINITY_DN778_c0_g1_i11:585-1013(-)
MYTKCHLYTPSLSLSLSFFLSLSLLLAPLVTSHAQHNLPSLSHSANALLSLLPMLSSFLLDRLARLEGMLPSEKGVVPFPNLPVADGEASNAADRKKKGRTRRVFKEEGRCKYRYSNKRCTKNIDEKAGSKYFCTVCIPPLV